MALRSYRKHVYPATTVTALGSTGQLDNLSRSDHPTVTALISCGTVTGTTPSLTPVLEASEDGTNWFTLQTGAAMTTNGAKQRLVGTEVVEPFVRVSWPAPTGTTPSFAGFTVTFVFN